MATTQSSSPRRHRAGIFDVRNIIGLLLAIYGVVLVLMGLVGTTARDVARAGGINANLWVGIVLLAAGAFFIVWARIRPIVVPDDPAEIDHDTGPRHGH